ncbi:MAG: hypothetical protein QOE54_1073 [Streptosporangiaceae bacterium]|jgi:hypothetical protein|nr:hypothetical protein [Streptosporangiaceae bacterium]
MFVSGDGESGKAAGNETIRITPDGTVSIKLPGPLTHLASAPHSRYVIAAPVVFAHRADKWADRRLPVRRTGIRRGRRAAGCSTADRTLR